MRWPAVQLGHFARGAGFARDDVVTAVALAIASSGGLSEYDYRPGLRGCGHHKGLWAIDTDRFPHYRSVDLHVPQQSAQAAYELTHDHGGWSWSPTYLAGTWQHYVDHAGVEASREYAGMNTAAPLTHHYHRDRISDSLDRLAQLSNAATLLGRRG